MASREHPEHSGTHLRAVRIANGLTQEELARRLGVSFVTVNRWENGRTRPAASVWRELEKLPPAGAPGPPGRGRAGPLIGRSAEMRTVESFVAANRLVTLVGPGGCGKTRLAVEVLARATSSATERVFVDLSAARDVRGMLAALRAALDLRDSAGRTTEKAILLRLRSSPAFVVLDNCEQVLEPIADLVAHILDDCPAVAILATSRERLRVAGELAWQVPPLSLSAGASIAEVQKSDAVRLFVSRARLSVPGFRLSVENAGPIAAICRAVDGLPLAIELAASLAASVPLAEVSARTVEEGETPARGGPDRHRSLRDALDWSWAQLPAPERGILLHLAVFSGGFELEAAEAVCETRPFAPAIQALVEKSLVAFEGGRHRLLETVRSYALRLLDEAGGLEEASRRHAQYFLALGSTSPSGADSSESQIYINHANYTGAMTYWRDRGRTDELGQMVNNAVRSWMYYGHLSEGLAWVDTLLDAKLPVASRMRWLRTAAGLASAAMQVDAAAGYFGELLNSAREAGDDLAAAQALLGLGTIAQWRGESKVAVDALAESVAIPESAGERGIATGNRHYLGAACISSGDLDRARSELLRTLADARSGGSLDAEAWATIGLGDLAWVRDDGASAESRWADGLALFVRMGQSYTPSVVRGRLALARSLQGDDAAAYQHLIDAFDDSTPIGLSFVALIQAIVLANRLPATAATIFGAIDTVRELTGVVVPVPWREAYDAAHAAATSTLSRATFHAAYERGTVIPLIDACRAGLEDARVLVRLVAQAPGVSRRELEVLFRVAGGATNKEIARDLGLSVRTTERHLANSYAKIGARGRADAIGWVLRRQGDTP